MDFVHEEMPAFSMPEPPVSTISDSIAEAKSASLADETMKYKVTSLTAQY